MEDAGGVRVQAVYELFPFLAVYVEQKQVGSAKVLELDAGTYYYQGVSCVRSFPYSQTTIILLGEHGDELGRTINFEGIKKFEAWWDPFSWFVHETYVNKQESAAQLAKRLDVAGLVFQILYVEDKGGGCDLRLYRTPKTVPVPLWIEECHRQEVESYKKFKEESDERYRVALLEAERKRVEKEQEEEQKKKKEVEKIRQELEVAIGEIDAKGNNLARE